MLNDTALVAPVAAISVLTGLAVLVVLIRWGRATLVIADQTDRTVFLLDRDEIVDATATGRMVLELLDEDGWRADRLLGWLRQTFPDLPGAAGQLPQMRETVYLGRDGISRLDVVPDGDRVRLMLTQTGNGRITVDRICHDAALVELDALRRLGNDLPQPIWRRDADGNVTWANAAYLDLVRKVTGGEPAWPLHDVLADVAATPGARTRSQIGGGWFECCFTPGAGGMLTMATPIDALVEAETTLQAFKGTMSRTFAHLTVGLAIFDRTRRLAVFNPALTELTTLPVTLLVSQPTLDTFLDALRSRHMMPEPRDYASWRDRVATVETAAQKGTYSELWHLPGGRTYRVTGRPQPDGAFALLMEDISAEISLTRSFRAEIEMSRAVIDALPDAIVVFDRSGALTMTNTAYDRLWGTRTQDGMGHDSVVEAVACWRNNCEPGMLDDAVPDLTSARSTFEAELTLQDGRRVAMSVLPLSGRSTLVRFTLRAAEVSKLMPTRSHLLIEDRLKA